MSEKMPPQMSEQPYFDMRTPVLIPDANPGDVGVQHEREALLEALYKKLKEALDQNLSLEFYVWSKPGCGPCENLKQYLTDKQIIYKQNNNYESNEVLQIKVINIQSLQGQELIGRWVDNGLIEPPMGIIPRPLVLADNSGTQQVVVHMNQSMDIARVVEWAYNYKKEQLANG